MLQKSYFNSSISSMRRNGIKLLSKSNIYFVLGAMLLCMAVQPLFAQMSSSQLKTKIQSAIERHYHDQLKLEVTVKDPGDVTIKGTVPTYWDWRNVVEIVSRVEGVISMREQIAVVIGQQVPDNIIQAGILNNLKQDKALTAPDRVQVTVKDGVVVLTGSLLFGQVAQRVVDIASLHEGVKSVVNDIKMIPPPHSDEELTISVRDMIDTYFPLEKKTVQLKIEKGKATLTGAVTTLWAKNNLEKEVDRIAGIGEVQNDINVRPAR